MVCPALKRTSKKVESEIAKSSPALEGQREQLSDTAAGGSTAVPNSSHANDQDEVNRANRATSSVVTEDQTVTPLEPRTVETASDRGDLPRAQSTSSQKAASEESSPAQLFRQQRDAANRKPNFVQRVWGEVGLIEWPSIPNALLSTGLVVLIVAGSSVALFFVNLLLAEAFTSVYEAKRSPVEQLQDTLQPPPGTDARQQVEDSAQAAMKTFPDLSD